MRSLANAHALAAAMILLPAALLAADVDTKFHNAPASAQVAKNPYAGQEEAAQAGKELYTRDCLSCHGKLGQRHGQRAVAGGRKARIRLHRVKCSGLLRGATKRTACPPGRLCRQSSAGRSLPM